MASGLLNRIKPNTSASVPQPTNPGAISATGTNNTAATKTYTFTIVTKNYSTDIQLEWSRNNINWEFVYSGVSINNTMSVAPGATATITIWIGGYGSANGLFTNGSTNNNWDFEIRDETNTRITDWELDLRSLTAITLINCDGSKSAPYSIDNYGFSHMFYTSFNSKWASVIISHNFTGNITTLGNYALYNMYWGNEYVNLKLYSTSTHLQLLSPNIGTFAYAYMFNRTNITGRFTFYISPTTLADYACAYMFAASTISDIGNSQITSSSNSEASCYAMFMNCASLTAVPNNLLQATTLGRSCYQNMFRDCTSLTTVPSNLLPAQYTVNSCYATMFYNCTSLVTPPALPATYVTLSCYYQMFYHCTSLTTITALPATTLAVSCYEYMFWDCNSLAVYTASDTGHTIAWRVPTLGTGTIAANAVAGMLGQTNGDNINTPAINTTYYVVNTPV